MIKLYNINGESAVASYEELAQFKSSFDIIPTDANLTVDQLFDSKFDVVEIQETDFAELLPGFKALDVKTSRLLVADTLIKINSTYQPIHLLSEAVYTTVVNKVPTLKIAEPAIVVAEYEFALAMSYKLAQSGFLKIIIAMKDASAGVKIRNIITEFVFGVNVVIITLEELTQLDSTNGLLIINLDKQKYPDTYESITYFNFLSSHAVFVDLQSKKESGLVEEARRAELIVVDEVEILKTKYQSILELI